MEAKTKVEPSKLDAGAYWYIAAGKRPVICEKRQGEEFVRFTNGSRQSWIGADDWFVGPLQEPES